MIKLSSQIILLLTVALLVNSAYSQTTEFTYTGRLSDAGIPANGTYDLEFKIFDASSGGTLLATVDRLSTGVANGDYRLNLDFGGIFSGPSRYMEVSYRLSGSGNQYVVLPSRDNLTTPYAINAANASVATNSIQLGGVSSSQFVQTADSRLSDARVPLPGNPSYVQNSTSQQADSNFNISGTGTATTFNAATQFSIGGNRILNIPGIGNTFLGSGTGNVNTGDNNTFIGNSAGNLNSSGRWNTFIGSLAGASTTTGGSNVFVGFAGVMNTTGSYNTFIGLNVGSKNSSGAMNNFFGLDAGEFNTTGNENSFFGELSGMNNSTGQYNAFFGGGSGYTNTTGSRNTALGGGADVGSGNLTNATAVGGLTVVTQSNSLVLGNNANVGIGISAPTSKLQVIDTSNTGLRVQTNATGGTVASFGGNGAFNIDASGIGGGRFQVAENGSVTVGHSVNLGGNIGSLTVFGDSQLNTVTAANGIKVNILGTGGTTALCRNASNQISFCSSSARYKENIRGFSGGLSFVRRLQPITFNWKQNGMRDVGFRAEDVAKVDPLFVTYNDKGEVEGVKYDRISTALVNAVNELQAEIESLKQQIAAQKAQIRSLNKRISAHKR